MKLRTVATIIMISLVMTGRASGQFLSQRLSGNELLRECTSTKYYFESVACYTFVKSTVEAAEAEAASAQRITEAGEQGVKVQQSAKGVIEGTLGGLRWCLRETTTTEQAVDVVTAFLRNNPSYRDLPASGLVALALQQAWPCSQ